MTHTCWRRPLAVLVLLCVGCGSAPKPKPTAKPKAARPVVKKTYAVDTKEVVTLGGHPHTVWTRGRLRSLPVLLFVHEMGAPESPRAHVLDALTDHYIVVHYDQRGAGHSFPTIAQASLRLGRLVDDCLELIEVLRKRHRVPRVVVVGHDLGATIALLAAKKEPDVFWSAVAVSPVVDGHRSETVGWTYARDVARAADEHQWSKALDQIGPPPLRRLDHVRTLRKALVALGGVVYGKQSMESFDMLQKHAPTSYKAPPAKTVDESVRLAEQELRGDRLAVNLRSQVFDMVVPVFFAVGRLDRVNPSELTERYYLNLETRRGKRLVWFESSAHYPHVEEPARFVRLLTEDVRDVVRRVR